VFFLYVDEGANIELKDFQKISIVWGIALVALIGILVSSGQGYGNITVEEAANLIESRPHLIIVDVRTPAEFKEEHLDGAINLCIQCDPDSFVGTLDPNEEILLYCQSGVRSADGLQILNTKGYTKVYNMLDGINAWKEKGYAVVK
jgi:phage shock protein E